MDYMALGYQFMDAPRMAAMRLFYGWPVVIPTASHMRSVFSIFQPCPFSLSLSLIILTFAASQSAECLQRGV